ncbi:MAG: hypothetical protein A2Z29_01165 [Chloroflexi bacterium RBG_16_56_11]|nr:MAG: hypothetical protein A2Z29_01165 [Chloroflexi bacterium RBG_16_56_11]
MKRLVFIVLTVVAAGIILPGWRVLADPTHTRHENPNTATGILDKAGLLLSYSRLATAASEGRYRDAGDMLGEIERSDVPDEIRTSIERFDSLWRKLFASLDNLNSLLDRSALLLEQNQVDEAKPVLDEAGEEIQTASFLLNDVKTAVSRFGDELGVLSFGATPRLEQAFASLDHSIARLNELIERLNRLNRDLISQYIEKKMLAPTEITLEINPGQAFVGDDIVATGQLRGKNRPLSEKTLGILIDGRTVASVSTGTDGLYSVEFPLPYEYTGETTAMAEYKPTGHDSDIFLAGRSPPVTIESYFYPTLLKMTAPDKLYPGFPFTVSGEITGPEGLRERDIRVYLDNIELKTAKAAGRFSLSINLPASIVPGKNELEVVVPPEKRSAGAAARQSVHVSIMTYYIDTKVPSVVLLPSALPLAGTVIDDLGPTADAAVEIRLGEVMLITRTDRDGGFTARAKVLALPAGAPLAGNPFYVSYSPVNIGDFSPIGFHNIKISVVNPATPGPFKYQRRLITINPFSSGLVLALGASAGVALFRRKRRRRPASTSIPPAAEGAWLTVITSRESGPQLSGARDQIRLAYHHGLMHVERTTGVKMASHFTMREYLVRARLPAILMAGLFAELTGIAESSLYSPALPRPEEVEKAEKIAAGIEEAANHGTA